MISTFKHCLANLVLLLTLLPSLDLHGQGPWLGGGDIPRVIWDEKGGRITALTYFLQDLVWEQASGKSVAIRLPQHPLAPFSYFRGRMITYQPAQGADKHPLGTPGQIWESRNGTSWKQAHAWVPGLAGYGGEIRHIFQLEQDRYLLIGLFTDLSRKDASPFAIARVDSENRLRIHELMDPFLGMDRSTIRHTPQGSVLNAEDHFPLLPMLRGDSVVETDLHILLVDYFTGRVFVFERNGRLRRIKSIVPGWESRVEGRSCEGHDAVILVAAPTRKGHLLLATRTRDAIELAMKEYPRSYHHQKEFTVENRSAVERSVRAYPYVDWYRLDPSQGELRRVEPPAHVPTRFLDAHEMSSFRFIPQKDGSLQVFGFEGRR